jgi:hypothetical protein
VVVQDLRKLAGQLAAADDERLIAEPTSAAPPTNDCVDDHSPDHHQQEDRGRVRDDAEARPTILEDGHRRRDGATDQAA